MRIGEIQALKWTEIDLENRIIEVKRSWRKGRITDTKSKKRRRVDMTPQLAEALRELKGRFQLKVAGEVNASPFVFSGVRQEMLSRNSFRRAMEYCLKVADLKRIRVHDLRHSYATIRLMRGHNVGDVSYQLGHSSIKITYDTYGHWIPGSFKSEVDELDNVHPSAPYTHPETGIAQNLL